MLCGVVTCDACRLTELSEHQQKLLANSQGTAVIKPLQFDRTQVEAFRYSDMHITCPHLHIQISISLDTDLAISQYIMTSHDHCRYRVEDMSRSVTSAAVKEARLAEVRLELLNSEQLEAHFEDNPRELELLTHAKVLRSVYITAHE